MGPHEMLVDFRSRNSLSQVDLAKSLGVQSSTVSRLETGRTRPTIRLAARIAKVTGGSPSVLAWLDIDKADDLDEFRDELDNGPSVVASTDCGDASDFAAQPGMIPCSLPSSSPCQSASR